MPSDEFGESQRAVIYDLIKTSFGNFAFWRRIEPQIVAHCSDIPEAVDEGGRKKLVEVLQRIRAFILEEGVDPRDLSFLDEEIDRYDNTLQISLYREDDDYLSDEIIAKYARMSNTTEGVVGIHLGLNYAQLARLTNGVYKQTGLIKFFVSKERTIYGKVSAEIYDHQQDIPVATLLHSKTRSEDGEYQKRIVLFGQKYDRKKFVVVKEIPAPMHVYRFITEKNQELILLSTEPVSAGDYILTGVMTECDDLKQLTDSSKMMTKLPFFFAKEIRSRIIKYANHDEFRMRLGALDIRKSTVFNYPFSVYIKQRGAVFTLRHPDWFKWLIWAWLTHAKKGIVNEYPLHILIVGPKGSGKSILMNGLHAISKETRSIFSGVSSTLKYLIPSFHGKPAKIGYLAESNRFAFCDEFLRCMVNTRVSTDGNEREESLTKMNDILEHQEREFGSGVSKANINMTCRVIAATNPIKGVHGMSDLQHAMDESFLSRWLVYYQKEDGEHVAGVRTARASDLKEYPFELNVNDWISLLDYLWTFHATYDAKRLEAIFDSQLPVLSADLKNHYTPRHFHHLECIMDGLVKTRCIFEHDMRFAAKEEDYERLQLIWRKVIGSWIDVEMTRKLPVKDRIHYLPENAQWLYNAICDLKRPVPRYETEAIALAEMTKQEYTEAFVILREYGLIYDEDGNVKPHYMVREEQ